MINRVTARLTAELTTFDHARKFVVWKGRKIPLVRGRAHMWRLRARTRHLQVDVSLGTTNETAARTIARRLLEDGVAVETERRGPASATLRQLAEVYLSTPKRVARVSALSNVNRLAGIVRLVHGKELDEIKVKAVTAELWTAYQRKRYEAIGRALDYTRRLPENAAINAIVRAARSVFIRRLRPAYARAGIHLSEDADVVTWLPEAVLVRAPADDGALIAAWAALEDRALWLAVGLARFAGLRLAEIAACDRAWIIADSAGAVAIDIRDRPEAGFQHKVGIPYQAPVLNPELAAALVLAPAGLIVRPAVTARQKWFDTVPQRWVRPFVGTARQPMHRLRGLYATDLAEQTRAAVAARLAGDQAAAAALGHTTTKTTKRHYLD